LEAAEATERFRETAEEEHHVEDRFRRRAAIVVGVLAMLLAITHLAGAEATKETINYNILASDTWAFFQAKNIRQTSTQLTADELQLRLVTEPGLSDEAKNAIQQQIDKYKATITRYDSEPDPKDPNNPLKGDGKKELMKRAQYYEKHRDHAQQQIPSFEYGEALFQIGIVVASVSIVASARWLLGFGIVLGAVAVVLLLNGYLLFLPIGEVPH
jgi:hypothetical protein